MNISLPTRRTLIKSGRVILFAALAAAFTAAIGEVGTIPDPTLAAALTAGLEFAYRIVRGWLGMEPVA